MHIFAKKRVGFHRDHYKAPRQVGRGVVSIIGADVEYQIAFGHLSGSQIIVTHFTTRLWFGSQPGESGSNLFVGA
jgi:hypothetical protein